MVGNQDSDARLNQALQRLFQEVYQVTTDQNVSSMSEQQQASFKEKRQQAQSRLITAIMNSGKLTPPEQLFKTEKPRTSLSQFSRKERSDNKDENLSLYNNLLSQLPRAIKKHLYQYKSEQPVINWVNQILENLYEDIQLNSHLQNLIQDVLKAPEGIAKRKAKKQLLEAIYNSGQLSHPFRRQLQLTEEDYEDIYHDALLRTYEYLLKNLDKYQDDKPVMAWVNIILKSRFIDVSRRVFKDKGNQQKISPPPPSLPADDEENLFEKLIICLEQNSIYGETHIRGYPDVTFKLLLLKRVENIKWKDISTEFQIRISALSSFFQRKLRDFKDDLWSCIQQH